MGISLALGLAALLKEAGVGVRPSSGGSRARDTGGLLPCSWWHRCPARPADDSLWCTIAQPQVRAAVQISPWQRASAVMDTGLQDLEECWVALEAVHPVQGLEVAYRMPGYPF